MKEGKIIIFSAPSGAGKTTIVRHLLSNYPDFAFSVSATSRRPRGREVDGVDYFFLTADEFKAKINNDEFLEWQEVYPGGSNIKKYYGDRALALFIQPPSITELEKRLIARCTDDKEVIKKRVEKAERELAYANLFDVIIVNDTLEHALKETEDRVQAFLEGNSGIR